MLNWCYGIFSVWLILSIFFRKRQPFFDARMMVEAGMLMYYAVPGMRHAAPELWDYTSRYYIFYGLESVATFKAFVCVILFYIAFLVFHQYRFSISPVQKNQSYKLYIPNEEKTVFKTARIIIIFCLALFLVYCSFFGGFRELMSNISNIRGGIVQSDNGKFEFINKLFRCAPFAVYLTADYRNSRYRWQYKLMLAIALLIVISYGGRGVLLQFVGTLFIGDYIYRKNISHKKYSVRKILFLAFFAVFAIVIYRPLLNSMVYVRTKGIEKAMSVFVSILMNSGKYNISSIGKTVSSLLTSFDHYSVSLETSIYAVDTGMHDCRYFMEWVIDAFSVVPSLLIGITKSPTITYFNSMYIAGAPNIAQIPSGIVAEAYYTGGVLWVVFYGAIMGSIGRKIEILFQRMKDSITFAPTFYFALLFFYFAFAVGGDWASLFQKNLTTFMIIFYIRWKMIRSRGGLHEI